MFKLVIFDVDGTMIDTEEVVLNSYRYAIYEEFGRQFTQEELSVAYGIPTLQAMERLGVKDIDRACERYFESLFESYAEGIRLFDGIIQLLEELKKRNIVCGIVTSRNKGEVANDVTLQALMKYFDYVICAEDTKKHKPDAEPVNKLLEMAGTDASEVIYLGDTFYDYMCAKNAGAKFALASWGARPDEKIKEDYMLVEPADLLAFV